jgi:hypothetical protein
MVKVGRLLLVGLVSILGAPTLLFAQASIAGVVKDPSGAALPGVTVEAASSVLIEKTRSVVTDGTGQYQIIDLRPGTYSITFTISGFTPLKREGVELVGAFAATVNAELRVGGINETITVTGEAPVVDVRSVSRQRVMGADVIDVLPTGRTHLNAANLIPGIATSNPDIGGSTTIGIVSAITLHGSRGGDLRVTLDGLSTANAELAGQASNFLPNMGSTQEVTIDYAAGSAEQGTGGVRINLIPREGGNTFKGSFFGTAVNSSFQTSNFTQELKDAGLATPDTIKFNYDWNMSGGGPVSVDRLWFYASGRWTGNQNYTGGLFFNKNAGDPNLWSYVPDTERPAFSDSWQRSLNARLTWQATPKQKITAYVDDQGRCQCPNVSAVRAPEAANNIRYPVNRLTSASWTSARTTRLLLEARVQSRLETYGYSPTPAGDPSLKLIVVNDQTTGLRYRGPGFGSTLNTSPFSYVQANMTSVSGSAAYVTGTHAFKVGLTDTFGTRDVTNTDNDYHMVYRVNNYTAAIPNQFQMNATPLNHIEGQKADLGLYAQDKWSLKRLTLNLGLRFDYYANYFPEQHLGPGLLVPNRNVTFPETPWASWKDVTPRLGAAYDLFGNGKTALKTSLNKYMIAFGLQGPFGDASNPVLRMANFVTRNWTDTNRNYVPDCDVLNPAAQGPTLAGVLQTVDTCGAMSDANFGKPTTSTTVDPEILSGHRGYNWEFSGGVQHELLPRVSLDVSYFRRWYGDFTVTDNRAVAPTDYTPFSVVAPNDARLPSGGAYTVSGLYDLNPNRVGQVDNFFTLAGNFGQQYEHWNGVDVVLNARPGRGIVLQGGLSTGRTMTDNCEVVTKVDNPSPLYCHQETNWLGQTQVKFIGSFNVPRADVQVSGTLQSVPGPTVLANYVAINALVQPSLGRPLSGNAANVTVNVVEPGSLYGQRLNELDLRFSKILKFARTRTSLNLDVYNVFNANTVLTQNNSYAVWQQPQTILLARFAKISVQFDF